MAIDLSQKGTKVFTSINSPFTNSDTIVIEYNDILRPLGFDVLRTMRTSIILDKIMDVGSIQNISNMELFEWYLFRDEINVFKNFNLNEELFKDIEDEFDWLDEFFFKEIDELNILDIAIKYRLYDTLPSLCNQDLIKNVYVYTDKYSSSIEKDIKENFGIKAIYIYGDFIDSLKNHNINNETTYILSDILKLELLKENNLLEFSSILLSEGYGYNFDNDKPLIDLEELLNNTLFKIFYFNPIDISEDYEKIFI